VEHLQQHRHLLQVKQTNTHLRKANNEDLFGKNTQASGMNRFERLDSLAELECQFGCPSQSTSSHRHDLFPQGF
jgi:hypothetical protein